MNGVFAEERSTYRDMLADQRFVFGIELSRNHEL